MILHEFSSMEWPRCPNSGRRLHPRPYREGRPGHSQTQPDGGHRQGARQEATLRKVNGPVKETGGHANAAIRGVALDGFPSLLRNRLGPPPCMVHERVSCPVEDPPDPKNVESAFDPPRKDGRTLRASPRTSIAISLPSRPTPLPRARRCPEIGSRRPRGRPRAGVPRGVHLVEDHPRLAVDAHGLGAPARRRGHSLHEETGRIRFAGTTSAAPSSSANQRSGRFLEPMGKATGGI